MNTKPLGLQLSDTPEKIGARNVFKSQTETNVCNTVKTLNIWKQVLTNNSARLRGIKTVVMLNWADHEIGSADKYKNVKMTTYLLFHYLQAEKITYSAKLSK